MINKKNFKTNSKVRSSFKAHGSNQNVEQIQTKNFSSFKTVPNIFFNACFDKNHLKTVIAWFLEQYGEKLTVDLVETLKQVGFHQATRAGVSLGLDDLKIPPQKNILLSQAAAKMADVNHALETGNLTSVEKSQRLIDTWNQTSETLRQTAVQNFRTTNPVNPVYMMAFSGARGNISQVRQLVAMRGLMADPQGAILEFPIQSNFREGLTVTEYLISCYGARKGLVDTALRTATSGYLTRRLVDAVQHVVIHVTNCHTKTGILIKEKNFEQRLIGRVLLKDVVLESNRTLKKDTLISPRLAKEIATKHNQIFVRSPLNCQTEKSVCQLCYGLDLAKGKLVSLGEAVGIIAAQSIGEPGTQLTMRTFHTGGVGVFSDQAMKTFLAPFEGKIEFLGSLPGLFVRTPHGNIVYLLKHKSRHPEKLLLRLKAVKTSKKSLVYEIKTEDVPAGSLLWVKQGEVVKSGQLLLQASRLQRSRQEMPESSHPVRAPRSGEIFFQSIKIRTIEEEKKLPFKPKKKKQPNRVLGQINQKEISPTFPTLLELGNFWVFSSFVQKENHVSSSFLIQGDLISPETPIQEYQFDVQEKGQLKRLNSDVVFANPVLEFQFSKVHYSRLFYFFITPEKNKNVLSYTTNKKITHLTWYPFYKNFDSGGCGYYLNLESELSSLNRGTHRACLATTQGVELNNPKLENLSLNSKSYLMSPHEVLDLTTAEKSSKLFSSCEFFISGPQSTFSKKGIFQIYEIPGLVWSLKKTFKTKPKLNFLNKKYAPFSKVKRNLCVGIPSSFRTTDSTSGTRSVSMSEEQSSIFNVESQRSSFLQRGIFLAQKPLNTKFKRKLIEKKEIWFYLPENFNKKAVDSQFTGMVLQPGKKFENLCFSHFYVSINFVLNENLFYLKSKTKANLHLLFRFLGVNQILKQNFLTDVNKSLNLPCESSPENAQESRGLLFSRIEWRNFTFYKKNESNQTHKERLRVEKGTNQQIPLSKNRTFLESHEFRHMEFKIKRKQRLSNMIFVQKLVYKIIPETKVFYQTWLSLQESSLNMRLAGEFSLGLNSPVFNKQAKTSFKPNKTQKVKFQSLNPTNSGWISIQTFLKILVEFETSTTTQKIEQFLLKKPVVFWNHKLYSNKNQLAISIVNRGFSGELLRGKKSFSKQFLVPGLTFLSYRKIILQNGINYSFQSFTDGWIVPNLILTRASLKAEKLGEFRRLQSKQNSFSLSILRNVDLANLIFPNNQNENPIKLASAKNIGKRIRWGDEFLPEFGTTLSGQILKITPNKITLRKGIPLLASIRGLVHITHNDLIQKNDLLITLRSRRLQTEDIVQGIPKIEQLFEARETQGGEIITNNMHMLLNKFFTFVRKIKPVSEAVEFSLSYIQKFLVENILQAYSNQGVHIAEKHVEVVVRQMTARVRITHGGESGFLPGEFIQLRVIEKINQGLIKKGRQQAAYEPIILGITKSVLQSESFLLAASFQQVSKVLVRSALAKKTDFLRGLHENVLVGQPIPAGTGIITSAHSRGNVMLSADLQKPLQSY